MQNVYYITPNSCLAERISFCTPFIKSFVWVVCCHVYRPRACIFFPPSFLCYEIWNVIILISLQLITSSASQNVIGLGSDLHYLDCKFCNGRNELFCLVRAFVFQLLCWHPNIKVFNSQHVSQKMTVKASLSLLNHSNCLSIVISQCLNANGVYFSMSHWKAAIMLHKLHRAHSVARWNPIVCHFASALPN